MYVYLQIDWLQSPSLLTNDYKVQKNIMCMPAKNADLLEWFSSTCLSYLIMDCSSIQLFSPLIVGGELCATYQCMASNCRELLVAMVNDYANLLITHRNFTQFLQNYINSEKSNIQLGYN